MLAKPRGMVYCIRMNNNKEDGGLQFVTTLLAYSLPILQFFFSQLSSSVQSLFLFEPYFTVVSVFTAIISYVMILVLRSTPWFTISPLQWKRKKRMREWDIHTNPSVYLNEEIKNYQAAHTQPPTIWSIRPDNIIIKVFLPMLAISFLAFMLLGVAYGSTSGFAVHDKGDAIKLLAQIISYTLFLVSSVLAFAHQYIRDSGQRKWQQHKNNKYEKAIRLARQRDAFREQKKVSLITQKDVDFSDPNSIIAFHIQVDDKYFVIVTDNAVDTIIIVKEFDDPAMAAEYVWGPQDQQRQETDNTGVIE